MKTMIGQSEECSIFLRIYIRLKYAIISNPQRNEGPNLQLESVAAAASRCVPFRLAPPLGSDAPAYPISPQYRPSRNSPPQFACNPLRGSSRAVVFSRENLAIPSRSFPN